MTRPRSALSAAYHWRLHRNVLAYIAILLFLIGAMAMAERWGLSRNLIGPIFLFSTVMIYALIGISSRTTDEDEYYVGQVLGRVAVHHHLAGDHAQVEFLGRFKKRID